MPGKINNLKRWGLIPENAKIKYPSNRGISMSMGKAEARKREKYMMLGCPVPPAQPQEPVMKLKNQIQDSIEKDELTLKLLQR